MEHITWGHCFGRLQDELLPLSRQWIQLDHRAATGVYSYESYRYLLDLVELEDVLLCPFLRYDGFNWAPLNFKRILRDKQASREALSFRGGRARQSTRDVVCLQLGYGLRGAICLHL